MQSPDLKQLQYDTGGILAQDYLATCRAGMRMLSSGDAPLRHFRARHGQGLEQCRGWEKGLNLGLEQFKALQKRVLSFVVEIAWLIAAQVSLRSWSLWLGALLLGVLGHWRSDQPSDVPPQSQTASFTTPRTVLVLSQYVHPFCIYQRLQVCKVEEDT